MTQQGDARSVFISYAHQDAAWAEELSEVLADAGVQPWLDSKEIQPGEHWAERVQDQLRKARFMVVLLTPSSAKSSWTYFEVGAAVADGKRIIPVISPDMAPGEIPNLLRSLQWLRASTPAETGEEIARAVKAGESKELG